jgi:hypothetical protein
MEMVMELMYENIKPEIRIIYKLYFLYSVLVLSVERLMVLE